MMEPFRPSPAFRMANKITAALIRWGAPLGTRRARLVLLTVPGRKSGAPRTSAVALTESKQGWLLVAVYGTCDWSRNLEHAGVAMVTQRRRSTQVQARRLPPAEAAPVLRELTMGAPAMVRSMTARYFSADADSPLQEWEREAIEHPVFLLKVIDEDAPTATTHTDDPARQRHEPSG
jgi:deazaflavin-dependent oxidoreductase (nitroreductase family)